jgi:uncharacterized protein YdbL (DUF1318 family)
MAWMTRLGAIVLIVLGVAISPAGAQSLDALKASGVVGEKIDGFVGVVDAGAPGNVRALVDQINEERRARYAEIAQKQGAPIDAVAKIAGQKLVERTPAGQYVMGADGAWRQK